MLLDSYPLLANSNHTSFIFLSRGPKGIIEKRISYQELYSHLFILSLGDWDQVTRSVNSNARSNNNDRNKVLSTVAHSIIDFFLNNKNVKLVFAGNTAVKNRLYQISINKHLLLIKELFEIEGCYQGNWENYEQGKNYEGFTMNERFGVNLIDTLFNYYKL